MSDVKMALYRNDTTEPVRLEIGTLPGKPPTVYECAPGETVAGPAGYVKIFRRAGLTLAIEGKEPEPAPAPAEVVQPPVQASEEKPKRKRKRPSEKVKESDGAH